MFGYYYAYAGRRGIVFPCKENLLFQSSELTDTALVSKTEAVPVLNLLSGDNTISGLGSNTIDTLTGTVTYTEDSGTITITGNGYISYLKDSAGNEYFITGDKDTTSLTSETGGDLTINGTSTQLWLYSRILDDPTEDISNLSNIEKVEAKLLSNAIYFNGTSQKASITFTNDVLMYISNVIDIYSEDSINAITWQTGDDAVTGLFEIDTDNRTLNIMFDGTDYKEGYQTYFALQRDNNGENETFLSFSFSEGLEGKSYAIETDAEIADFDDVNFCFGICNPNVIMQPDLPTSI